MQGWLHGRDPVSLTTTEKHTQMATGIEKPSNTPWVGLILPQVVSPQGLWGSHCADGHRWVTLLQCPHLVEQSPQRSLCAPRATVLQCLTSKHLLPTRSMGRTDWQCSMPPSISFPLGAREEDRLATLLPLKHSTLLPPLLHESL